MLPLPLRWHWFLAWRFRSAMPSSPHTTPLHSLHLDETGSTNADAMRLALKGEELPLWVIADRQTDGRGRAGRRWTSPEGNLYASVAFCCQAPIEKAGQLSLVAGISVIDAIRANTELAPDTGLRLKWPNDVLIGTAKAGGILVESTTARGSPGFLAVIGFGLNLEAAPDDLGRAATAISRHGKAPATREMLETLADKLTLWLDRWNAASDFESVRRAWIERAGPLGEAMTINTVQGLVSCTYQGLSGTGALRAEVKGKMREFSHGDVALAGTFVDDGAA
jgi:BirA family biotin operon repressor/biotin-[acetyl-CoA-carboxylase] ligase